MTVGKLIKTIFFVEILKGLALTLRTMFKPAVTRRYPLVKRPVQPGFRGLHALAKDEEGNMKCVGCKRCAAYCPSQCIYITAAMDKETKKMLVSKYDIEVLRCLYCGFCVEACPYGAVVLTEHYEYSDYKREALYMTKDKLLSNWDKYMTGKKGEEYFKKFWGPKPEDFGTPEGQAMFNKEKMRS
jgi:NADH-quinone oxidoreductase subunit I